MPTNTEMNNHLSDSATVNITSLQGAIFGPLLFMFYQGFPDSTNLVTFLFADDTAYLDPGKNLSLIARINTELLK
jgi:hypothetical protein